MRQKHFRKVPEFINNKLNELNTDLLQVGTLLQANEEEIKSGKLSHLGIIYKDEKVTFTSTIALTHATGIFARKNRLGYDIIHRDKPKYYHLYQATVPNFGDWTKGHHTIHWDRLVYHRTYIPPREWNLEIELLEKRTIGRDEQFIFKITIKQIFDRNDKNFEKDLFFGINLMQENVGSCDIFPSDLNKEDFVKLICVGWQIFPPGKVEEAINKINEQFQCKTKDQREKLKDRADFFNASGATEFIVGFGQNNKYFGAKFSEKLIVFENIEYGNAIYVLFETWETISKMSRTEILKTQDRNKDYIRLQHKGNWKDQLKKIIEDKI